MTYCLGMKLRQGLVFASDTRTNAGVDHIATFRKMHVFENPDERVVVLLSAGNLSITQSVVNLLEQSVHEVEAGEAPKDAQSLKTVSSLFGAARLVGEAVREVHSIDAAHLKAHSTDFNCSFILGGQIKGERPRLFQIYAAGNFIEAGDETPFFQIGETKYGKPILDRVITPETDLVQAAKCAIVSFDSTIRSNLSVGLPIDMMVYREGALRNHCQRRLMEDDSYLVGIRKQWGDGVRKLFIDLPEPKWVVEPGQSAKLTLR